MGRISSAIAERFRVEGEKRIETKGKGGIPRCLLILEDDLRIPERVKGG